MHKLRRQLGPWGVESITENVMYRVMCQVMCCVSSQCGTLCIKSACSRSRSMLVSVVVEGVCVIVVSSYGLSSWASEISRPFYVRTHL